MAIWGAGNVGKDGAANFVYEFKDDGLETMRVALREALGADECLYASLAMATAAAEAPDADYPRR